MAKRLIKVARDFNIGVSTIVDFLNNNGFDIENKPTAKVTSEMEEALQKEFQKSIAIKERADKMKVGRSNQSRKDSTISRSDDDVAVLEPPSEEQFTTDKDKISSKEDKESGKASATPMIERKVPKIGELKILGSIDISSKKRRSSGGKNRRREREEEIRRAKMFKEGKAKEAEKNKQLKKEMPVVNPPAVEESKKAPAINQKKSDSKENEDIAQQPAVSNEQPASTPTTTDEAVKANPAPTDEGEMIRAETPELRGLKVKGKIDLDKFSKKPRRRDKTADTGNRSASSNENGGNRSNSEREDRVKREPSNNTRRRKRKRKVITTPNPNAGREGANGERGSASSDSRRQDQKGGTERERGRTERERTQNRDSRPNDRNGSAGNSRPRTGDARPRTSGSGGNSTDNRSRGDRPERRRRERERFRQPTRKNDEPREVSKKEIEEKIKATMARLSGGGKKKRQKLRRENRDRQREKEEQKAQEELSEKIQVTEFISVSEFASLLDVAPTDIIMTCMNLGVIVSINQRLDAEIIELIAEEYEREIEFISAEEQVDEEVEVEDDPADLKPRSPIVTVMGHVDHGKTSLLDYIRNAKVAAGEAGGITQHIGAYEVKVGEENKKITFLDTPGHEAFTAMRARGAKVTDVAIVIIAADDSIMPQTKEAISHAQAAGVPIVFAINKIDKPGANPEKIKQELAEQNLLVEEWGGQYQSQDISAKTGDGIEELLEKILLESELLELQANPDKKAVGAILEASLDKGRGYVTKTLIQAGTLQIGDPIVAGEYSGKVKAMFNEHGKRVKVAGPSQPVMILGLNGAPQAGERFKGMESETEARQIASKRAQINREQTNRASKRISLDEIGRRLALGSFKELNLIVKGDVDGSIEALADSLLKLSVESVQVNVIHKAVGQIIESDVLLASASDAIIIGFQVRPSMNARKLAEQEGVEIKTYSIIYEAIDEITNAIEGMLEPTKEERIVCNVEVRETYKISKVGTVAGCYVQEGKITRNTFVRVIRDGIVVYPVKEGVTGEIESLKRFKDDVKEVKAGFECGLNVKNFNDIKVGDYIEGYEIVEIKQTLDKKR